MLAQLHPTERDEQGECGEARLGIKVFDSRQGSDQMSNGGRKLCYCNMWVKKCEMEALESERIEHVEEKSC